MLYIKMTFAVYGRALSCWKNICTCLAVWITGNTSLSYCWLVVVPSTAVSLISPFLLLAYHIVHFAGWRDIRMVEWIFRGPEFCVLLVHKPIDVEMTPSLNHKQSKPKVVRYCYTNCRKSWQKLVLCWLSSIIIYTTCALLPGDWELDVTHFLRFWSCVLQFMNIVCLNADLCLPATSFLFSQTLLKCLYQIGDCGSCWCLSCD